jgi:hypothetical protein
MKNYKYWLLISIIILLCGGLFMKIHGISNEEQAQLDIYGFSTLQGLEGVYTPRVTVMSRTLKDSIKNFIEDTQNELDEACLSIQRELQEEVLLLLQKAGIRIVPIPKNNTNNDFVAYLGVDVTVRKPSKDSSLYAFTVQTELTQEVQLVRDPKIRADVPTWPNSAFHQSIFFVSGFSAMKEAIRGEVTSQIKQFIEDYLAANLRKQTAEMKQKS